MPNRMHHNPSRHHRHRFLSQRCTPLRNRGPVLCCMPFFADMICLLCRIQRFVTHVKTAVSFEESSEVSVTLVTETVELEAEVKKLQRRTKVQLF